MTKLGTHTAGDTAIIDVKVTPAAALVGATVTARMWAGKASDPALLITKSSGDGIDAEDIDVEAGSVAVRIQEADCEGFPLRDVDLQVAVTIESEAVGKKTFRGYTLTVLPLPEEAE